MPPSWLNAWDLWVDYQRTDGDGLTHTRLKDAKPGAVIQVGDTCLVGAEDSELAVAEVVEIDEDGIVLVRVLPGSADDHRHLLGDRAAT